VEKIAFGGGFPFLEYLLSEAGKKSGGEGEFEEEGVHGEGGTYRSWILRTFESIDLRGQLWGKKSGGKVYRWDDKYYGPT